MPLGPVVGRDETHELGRAVDEVHRREARADHGAHAIERELEDVLRTVGAQERVHDLAHRDEVALRRRLGRPRGANGVRVAYRRRGIG